MGQKQCSDYQVFGMQMPGRNGSTGDYRYGFNGMEKDDEVKGEGNSLDFGARIYDSRIGRWLSLDPLARKYPSISDYSSMAGNPILFKDPDGREIIIYYKDADNKLQPYKYGSGLPLPDNDYVKRTVKTLNRLKRKKKYDKIGIVEYLENHKDATITIEELEGGGSASFGRGTVEVGGKLKMLADDEQSFPILWNSDEGYISEDFENRQSAEMILLHEMAHHYYTLADPQGYMEEVINIFNDSELLPEEKYKKYFEYLDNMENEVGDFDTYSDRWIIQNVEDVRGEGKRTNHNSGYFLKIDRSGIIGEILDFVGVFSKRGNTFREPGETKTKDINEGQTKSRSPRYL
jgi:RHS repeat-associated protein